MMYGANSSMLTKYNSGQLILKMEIQNALKFLKSDKTPDHDNIITEMIIALEQRFPIF